VSKLSPRALVRGPICTALDAHPFGDGDGGGEHIARQLIGAVLKDNPGDSGELRHELHR
jgi:hypothetical protein